MGRFEDKHILLLFSDSSDLKVREHPCHMPNNDHGDGNDEHGDDEHGDDEHGEDENLAISSQVSPPSCRPARSNTICFQSEQKSETIFHQNGKYQNFHLPCFIK